MGDTYRSRNKFIKLVLWKSQNVAFEGRWIQEPVTPQILTRFPAIRHFTRRPKKGWLPTQSISLGSTLSLHCYNKQWSFCCRKRTEFPPINTTCAFLSISCISWCTRASEGSVGVITKCIRTAIVGICHTLIDISNTFYIKQRNAQWVKN